MSIRLLRILLLALFVGTLAPSMMAQDGKPTPRIQGGDRKLARLLYFPAAGTRPFRIPGQFSFTYGAPEWKEEFTASLERAKGKTARFRFGKDWWTTFDTTCVLDIGGAKVEVGQYYCSLEHTKDGGFNLILLDPMEVLSKAQDPFQSGQIQGGIACPLKHSKAEETVTALGIDIVENKDDHLKAGLKIVWGKHVLEAPIGITL